MSFVARGVIVPIFSHFTSGGAALDEAVTREHVDWLIGKGVHGIMTAGTTGELALLSTNERKTLLEIVMDEASGKIPVMAHVGAATTQDTLDMALHARACGVDAISIVTPYYHGLSEQELVGHFCCVADRVPELPVYLYNIPQNAVNSISKALVESVVARSPNVAGAKDSSGSLQSMADLVELSGGSFQVICGSDGLVVQALERGACAAVSGNANAFPEIMLKVFEAYWRGDPEAASGQLARLGEVRKALGAGPYLSLLKSALRARGVRTGALRPPLADLPSEAQEAIRVRLAEVDLS